METIKSMTSQSRLNQLTSPLPTQITAYIVPFFNPNVVLGKTQRAEKRKLKGSQLEFVYSVEKYKRVEGGIGVSDGDDFS